jgi:hypothetical protein
MKQEVAERIAQRAIAAMVDYERKGLDLEKPFTLVHTLADRVFKEPMALAWKADKGDCKRAKMLAERAMAHVLVLYTNPTNGTVLRVARLEIEGSLRESL